MIKNLKQKIAFALGSLPMFNTLRSISLLRAKALLPINLANYFGISMPAFVALHIVEHILPYGYPRKAIKIGKIMIGLAFIITSNFVDGVSSQTLKVLNLPDMPLKMQGTIGVPVSQVI